MLSILIRRWWIPFLAGGCALTFGAAMITWENVTVSGLALAFGLYCMADGIAFLIAARNRRTLENTLRTELLSVAAFSTCAGAVAIVWSGISIEWLSLVAAVWAAWRGIADFIFSFLLRKLVTHRHLLLLLGSASILFNLSLLMSLLSGSGVTPWMIGVYAMARGVLLIAIGLDLRGHKQAFQFHEDLLPSLSENLLPYATSGVNASERGDNEVR